MKETHNFMNETHNLMKETRILLLDIFANILPQKHCQLYFKQVQWPSTKNNSNIKLIDWKLLTSLYSGTKWLSSMIGVLPFLGAQCPNLEYLQVVADQKWVIGLLERLVYILMTSSHASHARILFFFWQELISLIFLIVLSYIAA